MPVNHEIMKTEKKSRPTKTGKPVMIRLQDEPLDAINKWRRDQEDLPNLSEAIRRLIAIALESAKKRGRK